MYGHTFSQSVVGITAELEGEAIGIAGVAYARPYPLQCFSFLSEEMKKHPRIIIQAIRQLKVLLDSFSLPIYATPDADERGTADTFLRHVGFEEIEKGVYRWQHFH